MHDHRSPEPLSTEPRSPEIPEIPEIPENPENPEETSFREIIARRIERRALLKGAAAVAATLVATPKLLGAREARAEILGPGGLTFSAIAPSREDRIVLPDGYVHDVLSRWGDPIRRGAPVFDLDAQTAEAQGSQIGFNCDFLAHFPLPAWLDACVRRFGRPSPLAQDCLGAQYPRSSRRAARRALLTINHEYTSGSEMFPGYDPEAPTREQVDVELAAHGLSVIGLGRDRLGRWRHDLDSPFNRRITGETEMELTGPVRGVDAVKTSEDPTGTRVRGMFNNCGGGITPWGTLLTCEENFDQYFANAGSLSAEKAVLYGRLPAPSGASERKWERFHPRFDLSVEPNEYARFGYVVEIDPYDPGSTPKKRTALGRFKHEAAVPTISRSGQVVVYSGDDARFEHFYKFVTRGTVNPSSRAANLELLEEGTLYAARLSPDGAGTWLPLVFGSGPLTPENGFYSQADVILDTRRAARLLGATRMDRPEDIEVSPVTGKVYVALTNNTRRTDLAADPGEAAANPRAPNPCGHVIELVEDGGDHASTRFAWEIFLLCGEPSITEQGSDFAGFDPSQVSPIASPDNLELDAEGNLWIATDGMPEAPGFGQNDGIFAVPTEGVERGHLKQFLSGVPGCELTGLKLTTDQRALFASIQHPGAGGGLPNTVSQWPDGSNNPPRPSVIVVYREDGARIGT